MPPPALPSPLGLLQMMQVFVDFCMCQSLGRRTLDSPAFRMSYYTGQTNAREEAPLLGQNCSNREVLSSFPWRS